MASEPQALNVEDRAFRFMAGRVSLALTATVGERWRRNFERLQRPQDLARWLKAAGLASGRISTTDDQLALARELREAIYCCAKALVDGRELSRTDVSVINAAARAPTVAPQLSARRTVRWSADDAVAAALSVIARDAIDLFAGKWASRIRECESDQCALLFVDLSRPGRRRWCSSATCGSRARSAAYRSRSAH